DQTVVSVGTIRVHGDIGHDANVREFFFNGGECPEVEEVAVITLRRDLVLMLFVDDRKNVECVYAQLHTLLNFAEHGVQRKAIDARHAFHLYFFTGTFQQEKRENQIISIQGGFFHHRPNDLTLAVAARPRMIQAERHFYKVSKVNLSVWRLRLIPLKNMLADKAIDLPQTGIVLQEFCMPAQNAQVPTPRRSGLRPRRSSVETLVEG